MADMVGTDVSDLLTGAGSADRIEGLGGDDTISGLGGADRLQGDAGADRLYGGTGADTLDGGSGADRMYGGAGNDSYYVNAAGDVVVEVAGGSAGGTDIVYSAVDFTLGDNLENLRLYTSATLGTGNGLDNALTGNAAGNVLSGLAGADTLHGGEGADRLYGGKGEDRLHGDAGADTLDGGAGADWMEGGAGDDSYYVNASGDTVVETLGGSAGGKDTVYSAVAFTLGENFENLRLYKSAASGTGNGLANHIEGSGAANTLSGLGGADTLLGGDGADKLHGGTGDDTLAGTVVSAVGDWQFDGDVHLPAFGGDLLDGGSGTDTAVFPDLPQFDFKSGWSASPDMAVSLKTGRAVFTGLGVEDTLVSIENVVTGGGDDTITGSAGDNGIDAGGGANRVYGGAGDDTLAGTVVSAVGDWQFDGDVHLPAFGGDLLDGGSGTDTAVFPDLPQFDFKSGWSASPDMAVSLKTGRAVFTGLGVEDTLVSIENVVTGGGDDTITGSAGDNGIDAGGGANRVYGGAGDDTILVGATSREDVDLGPGDYLSKLFGGAGDDVLTGNGILRDYDSGDDSPAATYLSGGDGDDTLWQGKGSAVMNGGDGADAFHVEAQSWPMTGGGGSVAASLVSKATILDFDTSEGDVIHFKGAPASGDFAHVVPTFVGAADPGLNEVGYAVKGGDTVVTYDFAVEEMGSDGNGDPVDHLTFELTLADYTAPLHAGDFEFV